MTSKLSESVVGVTLPEFGPTAKPKPQQIVVASAYASVHTKNWVTPNKKPVLQRDRHVKGPAKMRGPKGTRRFDSTEEMLKAMWQDTDAQLAPYRFPDQESFKNVAKQTGKGLWSNILVKQILKAAPHLICEDCVAIPGCAGFYKVVDGEKKFTNASFRRGFVPEFTIIKTDAADLPVEFTYGWRTVLLRLVKSRDLTMNQINRIWGEVKYGDERAKHYAAYTQEFRT